MSRRTVLKWGNSLAFRIPAAIAKQMALCSGSRVELSFDGEKLILEKPAVVPISHRDLVQALKKSKPRRLVCVDYGAPRGKEIL